MKHILVFLFLGTVFQSMAQTNTNPYANLSGYQSQLNDCHTRQNQLNQNIDSINNAYRQKDEEYRQGLFCSKCRRSKSEIEATGQNFYQHLQDVGGHVIPATQGQLDTLRNTYLQSYNQATQAYQNCVKDCNNLAGQYNQTRAQDYQNAVQQQIQQQQAKEQQARDAYDAKQNQIREEMLAKLDAARQQNQLQEYNDPTARANNVLNGSGNESSVFANPTTGPPPTTNPEQGQLDALAYTKDEYNNSGGAGNNYGKENLTQVLDVPVPPAGDDLPATTYTDQDDNTQPEQTAVSAAFAPTGGGNAPTQPSDEYTKPLTPQEYIYGQGVNAQETLDRAMDGDQNAMNGFSTNYAAGMGSMLKTGVFTGVGAAIIVLAAPVEVPGVIAIAGGYALYHIAAPGISKVINLFLSSFPPNNNNNNTDN